MKGTGVDSAVTSIGGKKFRKGVAEIIVDKQHDDVLITQWDDKDVASSRGVEVVLPAWTRVSTGLRSSRGWRLVFFVL